MDEDWFY